MRKSFTTLLGASFAILFAASTPGADDLDTLLAQPPSASISAEDANRRIEMLRALISANPGRADEIEAYLIPFVRATKPPAAMLPPAPAPPEAKAKPLLLIQSPGGAATVIRATEYRKQGAVIIATAANGSRAVVQSSTLVGEMRWFADEEIENGAVDLKKLAGEYEIFARSMPAFREALEKESTRLRSIQEARDAAAKKIRDANEARVAEATSAIYDQAIAYKAAELAKMLLAAEKVRNELPAYAARIDEWAEPFRAHFTKMLDGNSFVNGAWVSNAELARQAMEKRQAAFLDSLDYQAGTQAIPEGALRGLFSAPLWQGAGLLLAGAGLLAAARRWKYSGVAGCILLAAAPVPPAVTFFLATRNPAFMPSAIAVADEQPIVDALSAAAGLDDAAAAPQKISGDALNGFISRHVRLCGTETTGAVRQSLVVCVRPGRLVAYEMFRDMNLSWIARIEADVPEGGGRPTLAGAWIGAMPCPGGLASQLWENLGPQLEGVLAASRILERFSVRIVAEGVIELDPLPDSSTATSMNP